MRFGIRFAALTFLLSASTAWSTTITADFETLAHPDAEVHSHGDFYAEKGIGFESLSLGGLNSFGMAHPSYAGSTALFHQMDGGYTGLYLVGGGSFDLVSIDLSPIGGRTANVLFEGTKTNGNVVSYGVVVDPIIGTQRFFFPG